MKKRNIIAITVIALAGGRGWHPFPPPPPGVSSGSRGDTAAVAATSGVSGSFLIALNSVSRGACSSWAEIAAPRRWVEGEGAGGSCAAGFGWARAEAASEAGPDLELGFGGRSGCFSGEVERRLPGPERGARVCPAALPDRKSVV